ncbi:hypothetical protein LOD99_13861 [Oopsacas minuta]|uniref:Uncharacterized protein n=1 Tax=Oopsacas minuta TaxID=111878 RepID=A0AAV7KIY9_9METZ|nr:hypothetical protein LOD99_13861 [Oopsacas minuta]
MMYTDKKIEDESDSDWDDMTTQPIVEPSTNSERSKLTKLSYIEDNSNHSNDKVDQIQPAQPSVNLQSVQSVRQESKVQQMQVGVPLGISRTLPKPSHSIPTPPISNNPRQGRRRKERSMDPPYEFRTLTDESDKYSLTKAVSAPLKSNKQYHTDQVAYKSRSYVTKRNSWDEVSEIPEDNSPTLIDRTVETVTTPQDTITVRLSGVTAQSIENNITSPLKYDIFPQHTIMKNITRSPAHDADTFTLPETSNPQLNPDTERMNLYVQRNGNIPEIIATRSLSPAVQLSPRDTPHGIHFNSTKINDGIYIFEEMSRDHVEYERDLQEVYMMNFAVRFERKIQRFWQEAFGCLRLCTSFFTFFFLECLRFFLRHLFQKLCIGLLIIFADHVWKPLLQCCYNGCIMPGCVLCANTSSSFMQVLKPILGCVYSLLREMGKCCRSVRLCESVYPGSMHKEYTRVNAHDI